MFPVTYIAGETVILQGKHDTFSEFIWTGTGPYHSMTPSDANAIVVWTQVMKVTISM